MTDIKQRPIKTVSHGECKGHEFAASANGRCVLTDNSAWAVRRSTFYVVNLHHSDDLTIINVIWAPKMGA